MKKKNFWTHAGILAVVFIAAVIVSSLITNRGSDDLAVDLQTATLPRVKFIIDDLQINTLVGYKDEMDITAMRDTITPVNEDSVNMVLERNNNSIDQIRYEIYSLDGEEIYQKGTAKEANGIVSIPLDGTLTEGQEAVLKITLAIEEDTVNYYTRIVFSESFGASSCLKFAQEFHDNTFAQNTTELAGYLESNEEGDNSTFQTVTIHSDISQVTWGELTPEIISAPEWDIKESNSSYTSILARYQVVCKEEDGSRETYNVREFFRVRSLKGTIYLLDYQRTMNQIFNGASSVLTEKGIDLGLAPLDTAYMTNQSGTVVSFVQERDLWTYNQEADELSLVFSFSNTEGNDIRNWYDQHQVRILKMDENGSTTFAVYGYMNRGDHEGQVGVDIFYFDIDKNSVEEKAFIPSNKSFAIAEDELGHLVYYSSDLNLLHILTGGTLYEIDLTSNLQKKLAENLEKGQYVTSEDGHLLAYQTNGTLNSSTAIEILNLETDKKMVIKSKADETIRPIGFISEDFIYGLAKSSDTGKNVSGQEITPMYQLEIQDSTGKIIKTYHTDNIYIIDAIVENNMLTVNRVIKQDNVYIGTTQDYITSNEAEEESNISLSTYISEGKGRQMILTYTEGISDKNPKILKPKQVALKSVMTIAFNDNIRTQKYYVYGMGAPAGAYTKAVYAIQKAESISGVVISSNQSYIWEKGNRDLAYDTGTAPFKAENVSALEACKNYMEQFEAEEVDLSGCTIEQVLYIINKGLPVIAVLNERQAVLLTSYTAETVTYINPETGEQSTVSYDTMNQMIAASGNTFIGYIR